MQPVTRRARSRAARTPIVVAALAALTLEACSKPTDPIATTRSYRMGFSHFSPRLSIPEILATLDKWQFRGDAGILLITPPWRSLLADTAPSTLIRRQPQVLQLEFGAIEFDPSLLMRLVAELGSGAAGGS